jgi:choline dehydrogenase-like flavoprotein
LLPGFGPSHAALMRQYARASVAIAMVHDETEGRVAPGEGDHLRIRYALNDDDRAQVALGLRETARLLLAGGAKQVVVPLNPPVVVETERDIDALTTELVRPCSPTFTAVHPMSTMRMSATPEDGVVDETGRHHYIDNLWVADGSLLPTSIGGPPQVTIYTLGRRVGRAVADALGAVSRP